MENIQFLWEKYEKYQKENEDHRLHGFLEDNILATLTIMAVYPVLVKFAIPWYMERRKPFKLKKAILIYNVFQVIASGASACMAELIQEYSQNMNSRELLYNLRIDLLSGIWKDETSVLSCTPIDKTSSGDFVATVLQAMYYVRLSDLIETIFYALRKKERQLSFLHVYHHTGNIMMGWLSVRYLPGGTACSVNGFNFAVHFLMYLYYLSVSHGSQSIKKFALKHKSNMTKIQLVQLIAIMWVSYDDATTPRCQGSFFFDAYTFGHVLLVFFLFLDFYYKNYIINTTKIE